MNTATRWSGIAFTAAVVVYFAGAFNTTVQAQDEAEAAPPGPPPAPVSVAPATSARFAPLLWAPGSVVSRADARISSEQDGRVTSIAEIGDRVRKGDALARLDDSLMRLQERQNLADIARIDAQLDYARSQEARLQQLVQKASIAGSQLDEASSQRRVLEQDLQRARVALEQTRHRLRNTTVRAPFDGMVAERFIQHGEYLGVGAAVVRLVSTTEIEVRAQAPVQLASRLSPGMQVTLKYGDGEISQNVRAVVPIGDESTRQFELRIALDGADWPIGSALEVGIPSSSPREVIAVPRDALVLRANETFVVRIGPDNTAERIVVRTGGVQGELVEVTGDVVAGDALVVRGGERLVPGQRVRVGAASEGQIAAGAD